MSLESLALKIADLDALSRLRALTDAESMRLENYIREEATIRNRAKRNGK